MDYFLYILIFIFGTVIGSFLNCVIWRIYKEESFLKGRSYCPSCRHKLSWYDLVPVFSFLVLGGRCRYCKKKISLQYPLVELATGILFLMLAIYNFPAIFFIISCFLIIIFVYDFRHYLIPDVVIYPAILIFCFWYFGRYLFFSDITKGEALGTAMSAFGAATFFLATVMVSRGQWMGIGDIKLALLMGLLLGWPNIFVALFLSFLIGAIIGVGMILLKKKTLKSEIPFGPFLVLGTFISLFWGRFIVNWYFSLLNQ